MTQLLPPKKEVALALLERSNVDVYLDPRARGVVVPPQFRKEPRLILKIGLNMPVPIPDLRLDEESMSCTLSFNRSPFYCVVPWSSVFAMVGEDGRGMVWPDDVPQELAVKVVEPGADAPREAPAPSPQGNRRAARGSKLAEDSPSPSSAAGRGSRKKKAGAKKDDQPRPVLVAVPSPAPSAPSLSASASSSSSAPASQREIEAGNGDRSREAPERRPRPAASSGGGRTGSDRSSGAERRDGVSAIPSAQASRGGSSRIPPQAPPAQQGPRPKRELPPYLRIVK